MFKTYSTMRFYPKKRKMINMETKEICKKARESSLILAGYDSDTKNKILLVLKEAVFASREKIIKANKDDLIQAEKNNISSAFLDRLTLKLERIKKMCDGVDEVIALPDPVGEVVEEYDVKSGLHIKRVRAPLGVIGIIYEARPNVTVDATVLCIKSGNAVILKGGKDAVNTNRAIYEAMREGLKTAGFNENLIGMLFSRESTIEMLKEDRYIDVVIPRGGENLKKLVISEATMPVLASAGGNCHIYVEESADIDSAANIIFNSKTQRPGVCNAIETLLVDKSIEDKLPILVKPLTFAGVKILGCEETAKYINCERATEEDYYTEFLDLIISVKVVSGLSEAIDFINEHSTRHSEAIITKNEKAAEKFLREVDSAAVYVNASTRFTDGFEFGMGAEMGISTQKLHARGPIGLKELTSVKFEIIGHGEIRK